MEEEEEEPYDSFLDEIRDIAARPMYYNRASEPITLQEWCNLHLLPEEIIVAKTQTPAGEVSTVWIGIDHALTGPPKIFETMVFGSDDEHEDVGIMRWRYSTEEEALHGHLEAVEMCGGPLID